MLGERARSSLPHDRTYTYMTIQTLKGKHEEEMLL
jgi:hypothetical protein